MPSIHTRVSAAIVAVLLSLAVGQAAASCLCKGDPSFAAIREELLAMEKNEQFLRSKIPGGRGGVSKALGDAIEASDRYHAQRLAEIIDEIGWPTRSRVGRDAAHAAWSIAQHAVFDTPLMRRCLELMEPYYGTDEIDGVDYAYLHDRFRAVGDMGLQRFGIVRRVLIDDEPNVDRRRREAGFTESLATYLGEPDRRLPTPEEVVARNLELARSYDQHIDTARRAAVRGDLSAAVDAYNEAMNARGFIQTEDVYDFAATLAQVDDRRSRFRAVRFLRVLAARGFTDAARVRQDERFAALDGDPLFAEILAIFDREAAWASAP